LVFVITAIVSIILVFISASHGNPNEGRIINEDNFIVFTPGLSLAALAILIFISGSFASLILFIAHRVTIFSWVLWLLWALFFVSIALTIYLIYGAIYYMSFKTNIHNDELRHKELFYPEFTFTFRDITRARFSRRMGNLILILYTETETLLEAEEHFVGFDLLIAAIERKGIIRIEEEL